MSEQRKLQKPKNQEVLSARDASEAEAKALLSQAVKILGKATDAETRVVTLETTLTAVRKRKAGYYWEAGRLLTEARKLAPYGTWTILLEDAKLPPVHDNNWRSLYEEFPDPTPIEDIKITEALALARERRAIRKKAIEGPPASKALAAASQVGKHRGDTPEPRDDGDNFGFRLWSEPGDEGLPIVHAVRKGQRGWTPQCRAQWDLGLGSGAPPLGDEADVNCPGCIGKLAAARAEAKLRQESKKPHGSEIGYVWEILEGEEPDAIDARWLPITAKKGKSVVTPEKTFGPGTGETYFYDRLEALETTKAKYQRIIEQDLAEMERLKAESARLNEEVRLARKKLHKVEALLNVES